MADSVPAIEYEETQNKAAALFRAIEVAAGAERLVAARRCHGSSLIDNYDSFTYNLVQYLGELGAEVLVHRHDADRRGGRRGAAPRPTW